MATIARIPFSEHPVDADFWLALARRAVAWAGQEGVELRDAIVLVPYAQLLAPARRAFAACGGWQPRVETTQTLRASIGPALPPQFEQLRLDAASDGLVAQGLLRRQSWARDWAKRDAPAFEQAARALVTTTKAMADAAAALPPARRAAWHDAARARLTPVEGPGAVERMLARMALEWAAASDSGDSDALFSLRPSAWLVVSAAGLPALTRGLLEHGGVPGLVVDTDPSPEAPFDVAARLAPPRRVVAEAFEGEAQAAALEVIEALRRGSTPVALIAHDRSLVRRVRALLDRADVSIRDETGWKLSTTRAAAQVMALLRAAHPRAGIDARLDWLKADTPGSAAHWRRSKARGGAAAPLEKREKPCGSARRLDWRRWCSAGCSRSSSGRRRCARRWATRGRMAADAAGAQVLAALRLDEPGDDAWQALARQTRLDLVEFTAWVDAVLEDATFVPPDDGEAAVVITPLSRALLRPFGAVVFPGTDERRLGAGVPADPLLGDALAREIGLADTAQRRLRDTLAFAQLMRAPQLVLLRRAADGIEPLSDSPWVERAMVARQRAGLPVPQEAPAAMPLRRRRARAGTPAGAGGSRGTAGVVERKRGRGPARLPLPVLRARRAAPGRGTRARRAAGKARLRQLDSCAAAPVPRRARGAGWRGGRNRAAACAGGRPAPGTRPRPGRADAVSGRPGSAGAGVRALAARARRRRLGLGERRAGDADRPAAPGRHRAARRDRPARPPCRRHPAHRLQDGGRSRAAAQGREPAGGHAAAVLRGAGRRWERCAAHRHVSRAGRAPRAAGDSLTKTWRRARKRCWTAWRGDLERIRAGTGMAALGEGRVCEYCEMRGLCRRDDWTP